VPDTNPRTIMLENRDYYLVDEGVIAAANTIYPGHLISFTAGEVILHATAADAALMVAVALENDLIGRTYADAYAAGETCYFAIPNPGARWYAWLEDAANVAKWAPLEANGAGALQPHTTGQVVAYANEAVNNTAGSTGPAAAARIIVRAA
jgi:hypothetical protein